MEKLPPPVANGDYGTPEHPRLVVGALSARRGDIEDGAWERDRTTLTRHTTKFSYVLDGDFINEGVSHPKGTEINVKPNTDHGPHTTKNGCSVLVTFSYPSILDDCALA